MEIQEEIHHFAGWEGGKWRENENINFVNKLAFPTIEALTYKAPSKNPSKKHFP